MRKIALLALASAKILSKATWNQARVSPRFPYGFVSPAEFREVMLNHAKMAASVTITMMLVMIGRMMGCLYFFNMQKKKVPLQGQFRHYFRICRNNRFTGNDRNNYPNVRFGRVDCPDVGVGVAPGIVFARCQGQHRAGAKRKGNHSRRRLLTHHAFSSQTLCD
ncbi:MAG: hypothetical protein EXS16_12045 [Gemmataceae bacterium]|nr:hypothetical protein [Gemmataceae bacterium]